MEKPTVSVVITDLDNTLFDWFHFWYHAFSAMVDEIVRISGLPRDRLLAEIQPIHEEHGTAEYAFLIEEIPSLRTLHPDGDLIKIYRPAIDAYRAARREHLRLYPGVMETLLTLRERGCLVVAYTESMGFYSNDRLRRLGLDGVIDVLYSPADHALPAHVTPDSVRSYPASHYELRETLHRHTPEGELKPNPQLLLDIIRDLGTSAEDVIYVGDSLVKDVTMAQQSKVRDVWAAYGSSHQREEYDLLRQVTHWTKEQVEREKNTSSTDIRPTYVLESGFAELLARFAFRRHATGEHANVYERTRDLIEVWKTIVEAQEHFNDLELRIRGMAITIIGVLLGAVAFAVREDLTLRAGGHEFPAAAFLILTAFLTVPAFWMMDRLWYHRLLQGAVRAGTRIEDSLSVVMPEIGLGKAISEASPATVLWKWKIHSTRKIDIFYALIGVVLLILFAVFLLVVSAVSEGPVEAGEGSASASTANAPITGTLSPAP